jgi:hypothetical protein
MNNNPSQNKYFIFALLFSIISLLNLSASAWAENSTLKKSPLLLLKVGGDLGIPYGLPGVHAEFGHPNLAAIFGLGNIRGIALGMGEKLPLCLFFGVSGTIVPYHAKFRPRLTVLYTTVSEYILHERSTYQGYYEENFPGLCVLLEIEIPIADLFYIEVGGGINEPFKGWDSIDDIWENSPPPQSSSSAVSYFSNSARNDIRFSLHIGFSIRLWSR